MAGGAARAAPLLFRSAARRHDFRARCRPRLTPRRSQYDGAGAGAGPACPRARPWIHPPVRHPPLRPSTDPAEARYARAHSTRHGLLPAHFADPCRGAPAVRPRRLARQPSPLSRVRPADPQRSGLRRLAPAQTRRHGAGGQQCHDHEHRGGCGRRTSCSGSRCPARAGQTPCGALLRPKPIRLRSSAPPRPS